MTIGNLYGVSFAVIFCVFFGGHGVRSSNFYFSIESNIGKSTMCKKSDAYNDKIMLYAYYINCIHIQSVCFHKSASCFKGAKSQSFPAAFQCDTPNVSIHTSHLSYIRIKLVCSHSSNRIVFYYLLKPET